MLCSANLHRLAIASVFALSTASACDDDKSAPKSESADEAKADEAKADEAKTDEAKTDEAKTDEAKADQAKADEAKAGKGTFSLKLGDVAWEADRATARVDDKRLRISASHTVMREGKVERQQLSLIVSDYAGPGDYEAALGSTFVGVGLDIDKAKAAKDSDAKTAAVAKEALQQSDVLTLKGAEVHVRSATDEVVDGTFQWRAPAGTNEPSLTEGEFHAVVKK